MTFKPTTDHASEWLRGGGPHSEVVISSRVRLARNVAGYPFLAEASSAQKHELASTCRQRLIESRFAPQMLWVDLNESTATDRQLLVERHLISRQHSSSHDTRGLAVSLDEAVAIMVNEEDHLRVQVLRSGMQLDDVYAQANQIDDVIESRINYAYSPRWGYLTACPTNVGTGIRVSVMLHLPALKLTGEIEKVRRAAKDMHLAVRGFYGEGTEAIGDFYQISNQTTLGRTEQEILGDFQNEVIPRIIEYETAAREALVQRRSSVLADKVHRARGLLSHARLLGSEETFYLLSHLRLGASTDQVRGVDIGRINELFLLTQPAHLQKIAGRRLSGAERREFRATFVRQRLGV
jgi:protein arginine kinase